jgi:hypothetical protein
MDEDVSFTYDTVYPDEDITHVLSLLPPPTLDTVSVNSDYGSDEEHVTMTISETFTDDIPEVVEPVTTVVETVPQHVEDPKVVFIVPYRDRPEQLKIFKDKMEPIIRQNPTYRILFINQCDTRGFNRGAIKNIGFLVVKQLYPKSYKRITLVFNDVDSIPKSSLFQYNTNDSIVKHFFGFTHALGGILSITCNDFEKVNGFPNYWGWGYEDNMLQKRVLKHKIRIDRSSFEPYTSSKIDHNPNSNERTVNRPDFQKYVNNVNDGIADIHNLKYVIENDMVNVFQFDTDVKYNPDIQEIYDLRNGPIPFKDMIPRRAPPKMRMMFT